MKMSSISGVPAIPRGVIYHRYTYQYRQPGMTLVRGVRVESDDRGISASVLRKNKEEGTAEGYRRAAIETGWTYPGVGIFDADDPLLAMYVESSSLKPFEKHLPDADSPYGSVPRGGFITGKEAIEQRGIDLRLFYDVDREEIKGLVRFDEGKTSIGPGYSVHGGGISAVLDEATAEAGKMMAFPYLATRRITHEMKKPVPSGTTLVVWTEVKAVKGCACALPMLVRCFVAGEIRDAVDGTVFASAEAELVNMVPFLDREG